METKPSDSEMTAALMSALRAKYARPEWCFMTEVPDGTGSKASRRADAVAYNLFPSKGNVMLCFELKASKSDLKRELNDGLKSNAIGQFADYFFLVCPDGIIDDSMLIPKTWGVLTYKNGKLRQTKRPVELEPKQMDKNFVAALLQSMLRENDSKISQMNNDIEKIVNKKLREDLEYYTRQQRESSERTIRQQKEELEKMSAWRDAMRKCYRDVYQDMFIDSGYCKRIRPPKTVDEIISDANIVNDLAAFIKIRRSLTEQAEYTMNSIRSHTRSLESALQGMQDILLKSDGVLKPENDEIRPKTKKELEECLGIPLF